MITTDLLHKFSQISHVKLRSTRQSFKAVNVSSFTANGLVHLPVMVQGDTVTVEFNVVSTLGGYEVILGRDFLQTGYSLIFGHVIQLKRLSTSGCTNVSSLVSDSSFSATSDKQASPSPNLPSVSKPLLNSAIDPQPGHDSFSQSSKHSTFIPIFNGPRNSQLARLIQKYSSAFAKDDNDVGCTNLATHRIVTNGPPVQSSPYKVPYHLRDGIRHDLSKMLARGIIERSQSSYCSPILSVPKPDGSRRLCVDFRRLNSQTQKDVYPMPSIEETLNRLSQSRVFSTLDLVSGFYQIPLDKKDKHKTAFQFDGELYQFTVMPFGVCNGPPSFQRLMNEVLRECRSFAIAYLDDIVVFSPDEDTHLQHLDQVFRAIIHAKLKFKTIKCKFMQYEISFLGHRVNGKGVLPLASKVAALEHFPAPKSAKAVRRFLGMASFYRRHIPSFAQIAIPLDELTHKNKQFNWTSECDMAFQHLKSAIASSKVLQLPDFSKDFHLHVDASGTAVGAVLSQYNQQVLLHIAFASHKLTSAETRYSTIDREVLALSWGCSHFQHYLLGRHCFAYTDHKPLLGLLNAKSLSPRQYRLIELLSGFNFSLKHIEGKRNVVADAFSRPVSAIQQQLPLSSFTTSQLNDPYCVNLNKYLADSTYTLPTHPQYKYFLRHQSQFSLCPDKGLLFRGLIVVPESLQQDVLKTFHDGHYGSAKMVWRLGREFWWYGLPTAVKKYVQSCLQCAQGKASGSISYHDGRLPSPGPYELVFIDIVGPLPAYDGFRFLLTMEDSFTKFARAVPLRSITAENIVNVFYRHWTSNFHVPVRLHSDNGTQFSSSLFREVCSSLGIHQSFSSPYHPQGNGGIERFHCTLKERLRCFPNPQAWPNNVFSAVLAYNSTQHSPTGSSPFMLAFGFQPVPPGLWVDRYTRGDSPLTSDLRRVWETVSSSPGSPSITSRNLQIGDLVLVRLPTPPSLTKPWSAPKKVIKITGPACAEVEDYGRVHFCRLKFFKKGEGC